MINYNSTFSKRFKQFLYAQQTYPYVMKNEYDIALKMCNIQNENIFVNIPADYNAFENLLDGINCTYIPLEINLCFSNETKYKYIENINKLPFKDDEVDVLLSMASLHHFHKHDRLEFYKECHRSSKKLVLGDVLKDSAQDIFLNNFVNKYNSSGHVGYFFEDNEKNILIQAGYNDIKIEIVEYNWIFNNDNEMIDFCKNLFGLDLATDDEIYKGINDILGKNFNWKLIYFICLK